MASLFVVRGRDQGKHFQLRSKVQRLGRDTSSDIQLLDSESSRNHAELHQQPDGVFQLVDLESSNGTRINGKQVTTQILSSGDRIEIGSTLLIFTGTSQPSALDAAHSVDIVQQSKSDRSQIVSSLGQSGSILGPGSSSSHANANDRSSSSQLDHPSSKDLSLGIQPAEAISHAAPTDENVEYTEASESSAADQVVSDRDLSNRAPETTSDSGDSDRSLEVMYLTAIAVGRTDDLNEVLNRVLQLVFDWVGADRGCVMLKDQETDQLRPDQLRPTARCDRDSTANSVLGKPMSISQTILQYVLDHKEGVRTSDATDDDRFESAASIVQAGVREALCVPLQGRYGIVGVMYVDTYTPPGQLIATGNRRRFTDDHLRLITAIGHQAALAIEDTTYYSALVQNERLAAMGQTITSLSHHIKNILQGISGGSYLIEAGLQRDDTDAVRRGWSIVDRNQERISNLVMDMLTFSKEREPEKVTGDLNATVSDAMELMTSRATEQGVALQNDLNNEIPAASFDPDAIHRVIINLVTNAIDATSSAQQGPRVLVRTDFLNDVGWIVDVADNGSGIQPEDRQRIFSLFESSKGMRGTGIGLPVCAKIMREHGGSIKVIDLPEHSGACFRLHLPIPSDDVDDNVDSFETMK